MKNSCERDELLGTFSPRGASDSATRSVASPKPVNTNIVSLD
ncbi:hypothetical protein [Pseudovibrio brasiliensis]|nr:hypothetical protein [Pseudovibrio brasiliensis]